MTSLFSPGRAEACSRGCSEAEPPDARRSPSALEGRRRCCFESTDSLRPVLVKLLMLGQRYRVDDKLEEVSESIYVMF